MPRTAINYDKVIQIRINQKLLDKCPNDKKFGTWIKELIENREMNMDVSLLRGLYNIMNNKMEPIKELDENEVKLLEKIEEVLKDEFE